MMLKKILDIIIKSYIDNAEFLRALQSKHGLQGKMSVWCKDKQRTRTATRICALLQGELLY